MAVKHYSGTKITGTSTTAKVFKKSGVKSAKKKDTYFNTSTGHNYICTVEGGPEKAKWKYTGTGIAKKPNKTVTDLGAPARTTVSGNNHWMKAAWKDPSAMTNAKSGARAQNLYVTWTLGIQVGKKKGSISSGEMKLAASATSSQVNLNSFKGYSRASFYPGNPKNGSAKPTTSRKLNSVIVKVQPHNSKGYGTAVSKTAAFKEPRTPAIAAFAFNSETGVVSTTITTNAGTDLQERYDTVYTVTVQDTRTGKTVTNTYASTSTSISVSRNISDYQQLSYDQYVRVTVSAYARGYAGNSESATRTIYVSYPAQVAINGVDVSSTDSAGKCTVRITPGSTTTHPVDRVRLEYLADVEYQDAREIPAGASWTSTDLLDDASCTALAIGVSELIPSRGHYTWVRVKSWHLNEAVLYRYSNYMKVDQLEMPAATAADDDIDILSAVPGADGESIQVLLGWNKDAEDDSTGTELTWSDEEDCWRSTEEPSKHDFTWSDGPVIHEEESYRDSALISIKGLSEGVKYYIRARRYLEGDVTTYSEYSNTASCITTDTPETVVASCDRYLATGASLPVYWTLSGDSLQTAWQIVSAGGEVVAEGEGSLSSALISSERILTFAENNSLTFTVQASTGSGFVISEEHTVTIIDAPTLSISAVTPMTAQPFSFTANVSRACDLKVIAAGRSISGQFPERVLSQTEGDTIHSDIYTPAWEEDENGLVATVTLPERLDFWDLGRYTLTVTAIDRSTGLQSEAKSAEVEVAWEHQAPDFASTETYVATADTEVVEDKAYYSYDSTTGAYEDILPEGDEDPQEEGWFEKIVTEYVVLTAVDMIDDSDVHHQAVTIALTPPPGADETDVYDVYRLTGDGAYLIGEGLPLTATVTDEYAPFGEDMTQYYRIAIRTVDGDVLFHDMEYVLEGSAMRFDWAGGTLELPYNIEISDKYKKDLQIRDHKDGSTDGYWNANIERTASLHSDLIRLQQQTEVDLARSLARYAGPVFVRTPDGSAYEADVQISDLSVGIALTAIAIDATEVGLTDEFILPPLPAEPEEVTEG